VREIGDGIRIPGARSDDDVGTNPLDTMQEHELEAEILRLQAKLACPA
jgi:hypothetical protein